VIAVVVLAAALAGLGGTSTAAGPAPKLAGCVPGSPPTVRPRAIIVACGDANFYFTNLAWSAWSAVQAKASGVAHLNDCRPYCAAGHFHTYRAIVTLSRPRTCTNGAREFTRLAWRYPGSAPAGLPAHGSQPLPCR